MLLAGEIDAAIVGGHEPPDARVVPLIPDPASAARAWHAKHGAIQVNHLVAVTESLARSRPDVVREVYRLLAESKRAAGLPTGVLDTTPFGLEANRRNLLGGHRLRLPPATHPAALHRGRALRRRDAGARRYLKAPS